MNVVDTVFKYINVVRSQCTYHVACNYILMQP